MEKKECSLISKVDGLSLALVYTPQRISPTIPSALVLLFANTIITINTVPMYFTSYQFCVVSCSDLCMTCTVLLLMCYIIFIMI